MSISTSMSKKHLASTLNFFIKLMFKIGKKGLVFSFTKLKIIQK